LKRFISFCFYITAAFSLQANELSPSISGKFDVGGYGLYLECFGDKKPTVVLESGFGGYGSNGLWQKVITQVSDSARGCLYDRAGLGKSDEGPIPFSSKDVAKRLEKLLKKSRSK